MKQFCKTFFKNNLRNQQLPVLLVPSGILLVFHSLFLKRFGVAYQFYQVFEGLAWCQ